MDGTTRNTVWPLASALAIRPLLPLQMDYDRSHDMLLAGVLDSNNQPQLLAVKAADLSTAWALALPSRSTALTVAEDGSRAYIGMANGQVLQINLATQAITQSFDISEGRDTIYFPTALAVRPGAVDTVAVSTSHVDAARLLRFHRLAVWQNGAPWPQVLEVGPALNNPAGGLRFADAATLITLNTETSGNVVLKVLVGNRTLTALFPGLEGRDFSQTLDMLGTDILVPGGLLIEPAQFKTKRWLDGIGGTFLALPGLGELCEVQLRGTDFTGGFDIRLATTGVARQEQIRRVRFDLPTLQTNDGRRPFIAGLQALGRGRVAVHLYESVTARSQLLVLDVESVAPLSAQSATVTQGASQGVQLTAVSHALTDVAFEAEGNRLVAAVASSAGPNGCALVVVDPASGSVETRLLLSSPPGRVFVSATGRIAYVSLPQERALQQVLLAAGGRLGWRIDGLPRAVLDLAISPADAEMIAFTTDSETSLYLYRNGSRVTAIGEFYPDVRYISSVTFTAPNTLVAADSRTTGQDLQRYSMDGNTLVETGRTRLPNAWAFAFSRYVSGLIYTLRSWARLDTAQAGGWILPPESVAFLQQFGYVAPDYDGVALVNERDGGAMRAHADGTVFFERLAPRAVSPLGGDLVGVRRLVVVDNGQPAPVPGTRFNIVLAGSGRWASLYTPPEATDATLYIVTGV